MLRTRAADKIIEFCPQNEFCAEPQGINYPESEQNPNRFSQFAKGLLVAGGTAFSIQQLFGGFFANNGDITRFNPDCLSSLTRGALLASLPRASMERTPTYQKIIPLISALPLTLGAKVAGKTVDQAKRGVASPVVTQRIVDQRLNVTDLENPMQLGLLPLRAIPKVLRFKRTLRT